jgi:hypothetical protein
MERKVQIYIEPIFESGDFQELELFNDETIEVTSTVQNIADISKVFTDVSLSFSVPATPKNNAIFQHFYNSDVDASVDHNVRRNAYIEIDLTPFRTGKISLEKANIKKGLADSYQITFYGDLLSLKDKFGEDKLSDVKEINGYSHPYTATEILNRITDDSIFYDVRYPLISWKNLWTISGAGTYNITQNSHPIFYNELFPAISVRRLMQTIGSKYGLTFTGSWMTDPRFIKCFLLLKNVTEKKFITETTDIDFDYTDDTSGTYFDISNTSQYPNSLHLQFLSASDVGLTGVVTNFSGQHNAAVSITTASTERWYIDTYSNGVYQNTVSGIGTDTSSILTRNNVDGINEYLTFQIRATGTMTLTVQIVYTFFYSALVGGAPVSNSGGYIADTPSFTLTGNVDLATLAPEIKVSDFVSGIIKEFNLTCYSTGKDIFTLQPLDEWYQEGAIVDITKHTDIDSIDVDRIKLYKKISFKYQESESFMNKNFKSLFFRDYGNTNAGYNYDGDEFTVDVPFENLLFNKFTGTDLQVGYHLNETFQSYVPKPTLLYMYDQQPCSFKFNNGTTHVTVSDYMPFGQDALINSTNYSLNFSADTSTLLEVPIANSLFGEYYFGYLTNLYNLKNRLINVKTNLPISLLTNLNLNDRLIIRDKRYIINTMKSNLRNGDVDFSLYLDFRPLRPAIINSVSSAAACYDYFVSVPRNYSATFSSSLGGVTINPTPLTASGFVTVCIPINTTGNERTIQITITLNNRDGNTLLDYIFIIQEP